MIRQTEPRRVSKDAYNFPKNSLEQALSVAKAIEEKFAGKPTPARELVKAVGFNKETDWRFLDLLRSSEQYGLTTGTGKTATIKLEPIGQDVVAPRSPDQRKAALSKAFRNVDLFDQVARHYEGKKIPEDEFFENTLTREFGIIRERVPVFIEVFKTNLQYVGSFLPVGDSEHPAMPAVAAVKADLLPSRQGSDHSNAPRQRQYLDNCFIIMPFGGMFDRYYQEIYVPATTDGGFEPVRADELFNTGTVIEQVWEQIDKAKVLLAEVTGKNANVFYELGMAHARGKPVVLVTANLDDVPFDLRHLRVITYDIREPKWAEKLGAQITTYLRNAREDPLKSIPQPFRALCREPVQ